MRDLNVMKEVKNEISKKTKIEYFKMKNRNILIFIWERKKSVRFFCFNPALMCVNIFV
jgi:hypothetical protein